MPRTKRVTSVPDVDLDAPPVLRAAGVRLPTRADLTKASRSGRAWQDRCWDFYDTIGEYRYGCDWVGSMLSRAKLYVAKDGHAIETQNGQIAGYMDSLFGGPDAQGQMLREIGVHFTVAGELYLIGTTVDGVDHWQVVASTELTTRSGQYYVSGKPVNSIGKPFVMRLWRPHPRRALQANSPSRAVLPVLAELDVLTKRVFAEIDSRLAGAGILFVPSSLSLPAAVTGTTADGKPVSMGPGSSNVDVLMNALQTAMTSAIEDQADPAALVPILVGADTDSIERGVKLQTFWSELDGVSIELRTEAIRRLALGLDMPPEVLTGTADLTHWNAWQLEESGIKAHIEPTLALITESLTQGYLYPLLVGDAGMAGADAERYTIEADTSELRLRPNRSKEAIELWNDKAISTRTMLREVGFDPDNDMPDAQELAARFTQGVAAGQTTPELVAAALKALGVDLGPVDTDTTTVHEARPDPSLQGHPVTGPPQRTITGPNQDGSPPAGEELSEGGDLVAAAEVIVYRALERAGNRLRNRIGRKPDGVTAAEMYLHVPVTGSSVDYLLEDAFTGLERYTACSGVDPGKLAASLDAYCRQLFKDRRPLDVHALAAYVEVARDASRHAVRAQEAVMVS